MGIEIRGDDEFKALLKNLMDKYPGVLDMALDDTADAISLKAQQIVPVDTGRLRASINVKREELKKTIGTNVEYASFVEFGSPIGTGENGGPKPYLRPAFETNKGRVPEFFMKNI
jgi:HK97 gp10 family phage protein